MTWQTYRTWRATSYFGVITAFVFALIGIWTSSGPAGATAALIGIPTVISSIVLWLYTADNHVPHHEKRTRLSMSNKRELRKVTQQKELEARIAKVDRELGLG